jgi:hypothetical protein
MAAEQAAGHRETAANGYLKILECEEDKLDTHIRDFLVDQINLCLYFTGRWQELKTFLESEEKRPNPRSTIPILSISSQQIDSMIKFEATRDPNVVSMSDWNVLSNSADVANEFSSHKMIGLAENTLRGVILRKSNDFDKNLSLCNEIVQNFLQQSLQTRSKEYLNQLTILNHICQKAANQNPNDNNWDSLYVDKTNGSLTLMG